MKEEEPEWRTLPLSDSSPAGDVAGSKKTIVTTLLRRSEIPVVYRYRCLLPTMLHIGEIKNNDDKLYSSEELRTQPGEPAVGGEIIL